MVAEKEVERLIRFMLIHHDVFKDVKMYSVGGFVRDELLGVESADLDIVINQRGGAEDFTKFIHDSFIDNCFRHRLGAHYPIWAIQFVNDVTFRNEKFLVQGASVDFADTQKEMFPDLRSRQRVSVFSTIEDDIKRRDFTVNMLCRDLRTGKICDFSGVSLTDLKEGVLRGHPEVSLDKMFSDDPLRMIRLFRFYAKYGWKIPLSVLRAVKRNASRISIVSYERIQLELVKIMKCGKLSDVIRLMDITKVLHYVLPEIEELKGVAHGKDHHFEGNVFKHTLLVLKNAKPTVIDQLSALFHDVGKKKTKCVENGKITFYGHECFSAKAANIILKRLKFKKEIIKKVEKSVLLHMRSRRTREWSLTAVRRFMRDCGDCLEHVLRLSSADAYGTLKAIDTPSHDSTVVLREKIKEVQKISTKSAPILNGHEIMDLLKIDPGKKVKKAKDLLLNIEDSYNGTVTKEFAKRKLQELWKLECDNL